jgi:regulator of replication initiation timing
MIPTSKLAEWRAACEKATAGEWDWDEDAQGHAYDVGALEDFLVACECTKDDATFIALARSALPELLDEVEALRAVYDAALIWAKEEDLDNYPALKAMRFTPSERETPCRRDALARHDGIRGHHQTGGQAMKLTPRSDSIIATAAQLEHLQRELAARDVECARLRKQLDGRIEWQVSAVAHMETWRGLFDAAVAMREGHEGCVTDPPCGSCFRCDFDKAVDEAMKATAADSPDSVLRSAALHTLRNCAACPDCGLGIAFDEDGCCASCGRDVFGFIDGRSANLLAHVEDYERVCEEVNRLRDMLRVSEEQNTALGDANVLAVENEKLRIEIATPEFRKAIDRDTAIENEKLRARLARVEPVMVAAKAWQAMMRTPARDDMTLADYHADDDIVHRLVLAIDSALAASQKEQG